MNSDVHPLVAGLVLLLTAVAIALWAWASGAAASFGGPAALNTGPGGHHFIEIQHYLVEHDADGAYLRTHDLDAIDVDVFLGGFAFFSNGDILLRRGPDPRSFLDNFRAYARETNRNSIVPEDPGSGLFRCNLGASDCSRFGEQGIDFKAAFSVFIDWQTDDVYVSDTTRHLLRKYSSDGSELAPPAGGFKFPNQLMLHDGQLLVADTNHHVIRSLDRDSSKFAELVDSKSVVPAAAKDAGQRWPSHFARVGDQWWVNIMQTGMNHGGIYVFDDEWQYLRRVDLPANADPIALLAVGEEVWVSDWNNDVVRRFSIGGEALPDLESAGLEEILTVARQERLRYTILSYAGAALVAVTLLGLMVRAFALAMNKGPGAVSAGSESIASTDDAAPLFLEPDKTLQKRMTMLLRGIMALTVLGAVPLVYIVMLVDKPDITLPLAGSVAGLVGIVLLIAWANRGNWGTSILVDGRTLTLRDYTGRKSSCAIREARFNDTAIATRDAIVILGNAKAQIYKRDDIQERLLPQLGDAQRLGPLGVLKLQIQLGHPQGLITVFAILGILVFGAVTLAL
jgi:hypothetical protein